MYKIDLKIYKVGLTNFKSDYKINSIFQIFSYLVTKFQNLV